MLICEQKIMLSLMNGEQVAACSCDNHNNMIKTRNSLAELKSQIHSEPETARQTISEHQNLGHGGASQNGLLY